MPAADGGVWSFGDNSSGQLGLGASSDSKDWTPAKVGGLAGAKVVQASCGAEHTLAVTGEEHNEAQSMEGL
jgi:alpha-tubulin suppressor-like RCC1 family protein